jgi:cytochrome b561
MNHLSVFLLARFIHVVAGVAWAGALIFIGLFLLPAGRATGQAGSAFMHQLVHVQRMPLYLMLLMAFTILSGLSLFWLDFAAFGPAWMHTGAGRTFSAGAVFGILTAVVGGVVNMPAAKKLGVLGASIQAAGTPPTPEQAAELGRLQNRLHSAGRWITVLVLLAVICMGVARYVP